jgi:hypothetical protein
MPALNFVAAEDGLEDDPKLLGLARLLKVPRAIAFYYVMRWQRLILHRGNHSLGSLPKSYTADDIAGFLGHKGDPNRLTLAMKKQGYLSYKKGRGYFYPAWKDTTTGRYACKRERDRLWHERQRTGARSAVERPSADVDRPSSDASAERLTTSERHQTGRNEESRSGLPPNPPPAGGASVADARWRWLEENAPTPQGREVCKKILERMTEEDWALVQRGYRALGQAGASISKKNRRALLWPTDQFLRKEAYLRFLPLARPTKTPSKPSASQLESDPTADIEGRLHGGDRFVTELLSDPDQPEEKKNAARNRWLADPANKDRRPPWVAALPTPIARGST